MDKKTKGILIVLVLIIIVIAIYLVYTYSKSDDIEVANLSNTILTENKDINSGIMENDIEETNNIIINETASEEYEEEVVEEDKNTPSESQESLNDNSELISVNDEDKAIEIAKKAWGNTDDVYFSIEQIASNEDYIIRVTSNATVLAWITVNVTTGEYAVEYN